VDSKTQNSEMNSTLNTQNSTLLEVCAGSIISAINAQKGGASRIELCDNLAEGGTTPSPGAIILAKKHLHIPVFVLIRPRSGDFLYSDIEFEQMKEEIFFCKERRAEGVVLGILKADGTVDLDRMAELVEMARPMQVTFHRAFDLTRDPFRAMEDIINLGIERILTSGQAAIAIEGAGLISELINKARNRIIIMPGGGITEHNVAELVKKTGAREVHASLRSPVKSIMEFKSDSASMGKQERDEYEWLETDVSRVRSFKNSL
jgi:copper homeostasis protein